MKKLFLIAALALVFLAGFFALWQLVQPLHGLNRISLYNLVFPGRDRLPFGENPQQAYNFSIGSLDAAFASHKISGDKTKDENELRVVVVGDSSSWGTLLRPEETICGQLDGRNLSDGRVIECFNLGYPTLSLAKDYLLLNRSMDYEPDLILWPMTLESFPVDKQSDNALIQANLDEFRAQFPEIDLVSDEGGFLDNSLWGQRREIADWLRLQLYGLLWAGTGIDQDYPGEYPAPQVDLTDDDTFHGVTGALPDDFLAWEILEKGIARAGNVPVLLINEPMLISNGENSEIRYNYYYPRTAYDSWHEALLIRAEQNGWNLLDLWNSLAITDFTNSAIHYNAESAHYIADLVFAEIEKFFTNETI